MVVVQRHIVNKLIQILFILYQLVGILIQEPQLNCYFSKLFSHYIMIIMCLLFIFLFISSKSIYYGFEIKHCNLNYNGVLCPNMNDNPVTADETRKPLSFKFPNTNQFSYFTPAAYFTRIDLEFRVAYDTDMNICTIDQSTSTKTPTQSLKNVLYRRLIFKFFRLCTQ